MESNDMLGTRNWACPRLSHDGTKCWNEERTAWCVPTCYASPCCVPSVGAQINALRMEVARLRAENRRLKETAK